MPQVLVVDAGPLTTIQDLGRFGYEAMGIPRGGAVDLYAFRWANRLALNAEGAAGLQVTLLGPTLTVSDDCWLATTGAESVTLDGEARPGWAGFRVRGGATVRVTGLTGARAYLAVNGGILVDPVLGSRSTDLESGFGGFQGRALRRGDVLPLAPSTVTHGPEQCLRHPDPPMAAQPISVHAVLGPRLDAFSEAAAQRFLETTFTVSPQSNHIGVRLDGPSLAAPPRGSRISEPMPIGGVQVTPAGQPIVLLNSRGTIGGYPLLATLASESVWKMGQARPGDEVVFRAVSVDEAAAITRSALGGALPPVLHPV
jgi:antagonist of KipI